MQVRFILTILLSCCEIGAVLLVILLWGLVVRKRRKKSIWIFIYLGIAVMTGIFAVAELFHVNGGTVCAIPSYWVLILNLVLLTVHIYFIWDLYKILVFEI